MESDNIQENIQEKRGLVGPAATITYGATVQNYNGVVYG